MLMSDIRRLDDEQLKLEADSLRRKLFEMQSKLKEAVVKKRKVLLLFELSFILSALLCSYNYFSLSFFLFHSGG